MSIAPHLSPSNAKHLEACRLLRMARDELDLIFNSGDHDPVSISVVIAAIDAFLSGEVK